MKRRKLKFIIGGIIVLVALSYLIYTGIRETGIYYLTVSELKVRSNTIYNQNFRVGGEVIPGSISWNSRSLELSFKITDGKENLKVIYKGIIPDIFKAGSEVVIEGVYTEEGIFHANTLLTKCPSKYKAKL
ncbi:MAG: cytochrome c maturation protein CcmE [Acidobacteriota bacterium]